MTGLQAALDAMDNGQPAQAAAISAELLQADADDQAALLLLGLAIAAQGDAERAQPILIRIAHLRSHRADPRHEVPSVLVRLRCRTLLLAQYTACLLQTPDDHRLLYCVAEFLHEAGALPAAAGLLAEGLRQHPGWAAAHQLLGIVYADQGRAGTAAAEFRKVTALAPEQAGGWANLGAMLRQQCRFDAALKAYDHAVELAAGDVRIRMNRTVALLHAGRLTEAWGDYEVRLTLPEHGGRMPDRLLPALSQLGDLTGRTVLVTHTDGFGDTLQFMRYLPLLARRGARVLAWVPRPLERVLGRVAGAAEVIAGDADPPAFDFQCPFVSLPRAFGTSLATIPADVPYLAADPLLAAHWATRLPRDRLLVGLVWSGQARPHLPGFDVTDGRRSTSLTMLAPLAAVEGVRFVNLQLGPAAEQARNPPAGLSLIDPMPEVTDFADTAGIVANLDVVVSVDTSVVHLAGAMGKPVLLLDRYDNCWRWLSGRVDSPWYPTLRIFRQKQPGDWAPVILRVAAALRRMVQDRAAAACRPCPPPLSRDAA